MARYVGIDISASHVRAALVRVGYRSTAVERLLEVERARVDTLEQALQSCVLPLIEHGEALAVAVDGEEAFIRQLTLPAGALKQLDEVLPFELEAQVPVEFDQLVYAHRLLPRTRSSSELLVLAAAAPTEQVRASIQLLQTALGRSPERVGCGPLPLANLATLSPQFSEAGPIALVDLGATRTEVLIVSGGEPLTARTLSRGMAGLPEGAPVLAAELRQTFAAWLTTGGEPIQRVWLLGFGALDPYGPAYLSHALGVAVEPLQPSAFSSVPPGVEANLPCFA